MKIKETSIAIKKIIDIKNIEILKDSKCFNALFGDLAPDLIDEKRIFQRAINDDILFSFYNMYSMSDAERNNEIFKADKYLREYMGFSIEWSYYIISSFIEAFGWENPLIIQEETSTHHEEIQGRNPVIDDKNSIVNELQQNAQKLRKEKSSLGILAVKRKKEIEKELYEIETKVKKMFSNHPPMDNKSLEMPIADIFSITGRGVVLVGSIEKGNMNIGDVVEINEQRGIVSAIECNRKLLNFAEPSDGTICVLVKNIITDTINRGDILYK